MLLKSQIINQIIKFLSTKLAENQSFQKLSLFTHEKIEGVRHATLKEISSRDLHQSIQRLLNKIIESGTDFINKK